MLVHLLHQGPAAQAFVVAVVLAVILLGAVLMRLAARQLNADVFLMQINKLLAADNFDRAVKLANAGAPRPVAQMIQFGLASWQGGVGSAREEMTRRMPEIVDDALRGLVGALTAGTAALAFGGALLLEKRDVADRPLILGAMGAVGVLLTIAALTSRRMRLDIASVVDRLGQ